MLVQREGIQTPWWSFSLSCASTSFIQPSLGHNDLIFQDFIPIHLISLTIYIRIICIWCLLITSTSHPIGLSRSRSHIRLARLQRQRLDQHPRASSSPSGAYEPTLLSITAESHVNSRFKGPSGSWREIRLDAKYPQDTCPSSAWQICR